MIGGGDTPSQTLYFKYALPTQGQNFILKYSPDTKILECGVGSGSSSMYIVDDNGEVVTNQGPPMSTQTTNIETRMAASGYEVTDTVEWPLDIAIGGQIENWSEFIEV